jgi:colanic acid/amylovoran biosynthesis protein
MERKKRILVIGLTSVPLGGMEWHNVGNYMIIEPLFDHLRSEFPKSDIVTTLQLSTSFCEQFDITSLREERFWTYRLPTAFATASDIVRLLLWRLSFPSDKANLVLENSRLLSEIEKADLVIDFSGDLFGENAQVNWFLEGCAELVFSQALGKPLVMLAGSPGPFYGWRKPVARYLLNRVSLITNREPISTELLIDLGIDESRVRTTACPSFLFKGRTVQEVEDILIAEGIGYNQATPLVGMIVSGWNMPNSPHNLVPRKKEELEPFVALARFLLDHIGVKVVLLSHSHRSNDNGQLRPGSDAKIMAQIYDMLGSSEWEDRLVLIRRPYDPATTKGILGSFDMLISGRLHGCISGLSQGIPTVIIDYGHEPKAHKLRGVARLLEVESYVCDPTDAEEMIETAEEVWDRRSEIRARLDERLKLVRKQALLNFELLRSFL